MILHIFGQNARIILHIFGQNARMIFMGHFCVRRLYPVAESQ